ncbi:MULTISPECIES: hypothetical protein [Streptomyces]|uniref:Uncharacterized protein n=1 Tax=Streptomyces mirabilis TaxID=68239 RepID=A0ABU3UC38_9ACTN|nr:MULTISPECIES: hypothetical protein [Streptomyces]MCX4616799.1 hypothetical protein [Streptomyces mirabilis]MCX5355027.1 hypothetical protein [Streptomyces mirabilis]MDU8991403.1 hypothetical protein [Streptomyces mirabilis]NMI54969.1 hypothetical protein [Streptomyces sp. RLA2-12]
MSSRATAGPRASPGRQGRPAELLYRVDDFKLVLSECLFSDGPLRS